MAAKGPRGDLRREGDAPGSAALTIALALGGGDGRRLGLLPQGPGERVGVPAATGSWYAARMVRPGFSSAVARTRHPPRRRPPSGLAVYVAPPS